MQNYDIRYDDKYGQLAQIDVAAEGAGYEPSVNQTLSGVVDSDDPDRLSTYAHNVKIITQNGQVTLKGPVRSEDEKKAIEAKAAEVAGENKVSSELNVKPQQ